MELFKQYLRIFIGGVILAVLGVAIIVGLSALSGVIIPRAEILWLIKFFCLIVLWAIAVFLLLGWGVSYSDGKSVPPQTLEVQLGTSSGSAKRGLTYKSFHQFTDLDGLWPTETRQYESAQLQVPITY